MGVVQIGQVGSQFRTGTTTTVVGDIQRHATRGHQQVVGRTGQSLHVIGRRKVRDVSQTYLGLGRTMRVGRIVDVVGDRRLEQGSHHLATTQYSQQLVVDVSFLGFSLSGRTEVGYLIQAHLGLGGVVRVVGVVDVTGDRCQGDRIDCGLGGQRGHHYVVGNTQLSSHRIGLAEVLHIAQAHLGLGHGMGVVLVVDVGVQRRHSEDVNQLLTTQHRQETVGGRAGFSFGLRCGGVVLNVAQPHLRLGGVVGIVAIVDVLIHPVAVQRLHHLSATQDGQVMGVADARLRGGNISDRVVQHVAQADLSLGDLVRIVLVVDVIGQAFRARSQDRITNAVQRRFQFLGADHVIQMPLVVDDREGDRQIDDLFPVDATRVEQLVGQDLQDLLGTDRPHAAQSLVVVLDRTLQGLIVKHERTVDAICTRQ